MTAANFVAGLWMARCFLCTESMQYLHLAYADAQHYIKKVNNFDSPQQMLDILCVDSELQVSEWHTRWGKIADLIAMIKPKTCGLFAFDNGDVLCVGHNFIADGETGKYQALNTLHECIEEAGEIVKLCILQLNLQRLDRRRPRKKRKTE